MTIRQPRNVDIINKDGQFDQQWIRYFEDIASTATTASGITGSKIVNSWPGTLASFPATDYATFDTRNTHPVLDFDQTTQETVYFQGVMPDNFATEDLIVQVWWTATTVTSGTVGWDVSFELMTGLDVDGDSFATAQTITAVTVSATNGTLQTSSVEITNGAAIDNLVAGDMFRLRIRRDVATDTAAEDAELHMVELRLV